MPRRHGRTRPFIDKKNAEHFVLMHRSQQDPKYYDEDASRYVLMSTRAQFATLLYAGPEDADDDGDEDVDAALSHDEDGSDAGTAEQDDTAGHGAHAASAAAPARRVTASKRDTSAAAFTEDMYAASASAPATSTQEERARNRRAQPGSKRRKPVARDVLVQPAGGPSRHGVHEVSEVDEYGFPLDGYDYSRHMREMGGGTFVSASGSVLAAARVAATHTAAARMDLPDEVLPARPEDELDRMLEAISMRPEKLPKDIRAALEAAENLDEEELEDAGVEELDDNFVMQAAGEEDVAPTDAAAASASAAGGDEIDFDFDAHIARLMAASEGVWTDTADDFDGDDNDDGEEDDEGAADEDEDGDAGMNTESKRGHRDAAGGRGDDALLAALLEEYDDDQIGELDEDDPRLHQSELPPSAAPEDDGADLPARVTRSEALSSLMDQYLADVEQEKVDSMLVTGVRPGTRTVPARPGLIPDGPAFVVADDAGEADTMPAHTDAAPVAPGGASAAFTVSTTRVPVAAAAPAPATRPVPFGFADGDFAYDTDSVLAAALRAPAKPKWDVETVISTYTNTENHPKKLSGGVSLTSSRTGHQARKLDATGSGPSPAETTAPVAVIRLSKKTGLPIASRAAVPAAVTEEADEEDSAGSDAASEDDDGTAARASNVRSKSETPEERRARKAAVKSERRQRREEKKSLRAAYSSEQVRQAQLLQHRDVLAGSVRM